MKFKPGDHVWCNHLKVSAPGHEDSWLHGELVRYSGDIVYVKIDGDKIGAYWTSTLKSYGVEIPKGSPVQQRCGRPATIVSYGDSERPIVATIKMPDGADRTLSYSKYGNFYKSMELPIDLVLQTDEIPF